MQREGRYPSQQMQMQQRDGYGGAQQQIMRGAYPTPNSRTVTPVNRGESFSPPPSQQASFQNQQSPTALDAPTQLKVKVNCPAASQTLTLVVPLNISYQSLKDRIDAKLQRSTAFSLSDKNGGGNLVKLKYLDEDDYVSIQSDEDVQTAFETWREQSGAQGQMGEVELWCK
jgi:cell division control protein 24